MTEKYAAINRMKSLLSEKEISVIRLKDVVFTTWPGYDKPYSDPRTYSIRELSYNQKKNELTVWQRWDQTNSGHYIEDFEDEKVLMIEAALNDTLEHAKKYSVKVTACTHVLATSPENAVLTVDHMSLDDTRKVSDTFKAIEVE